MRNRGERLARTFLLIGVFALSTAGAAWASLEIVKPSEVEERYVVRRGSSAFLVVDGREWELVTDPRSPSISTLGDGSFHPMDLSTVREAVRDLRTSVRVSGRILVLPYPRLETLRSSCEGGTIFLSPGIREVSPEHVHATVVHELGHLIQHERLAEGSPAWSEYVRRRSLDPARFHALAAHRDRPREIFAEDFRFLLGGSLATSSGSIENPALPLPSEIAGLREWFEGIVRRTPASVSADGARSSISPNPFRAATDGALRIRFPRDDDSRRGPFHADVYDPSGRRVSSVTASNAGADVVEFFWNGRTAAGRRVASGIYFVRWREDPVAGSARVHILR